ncbi:MAG: sigma-70 family RNA polymerase sigma factor [Candidatus Latescibacteria bacterium]|nr:sigma-70 family RNA polymerase sigma factor [Candidatus Latescibacterota bacterium]NIM64556.1 sigma-70 family RNA polymerase sigma factor [Candidatus Latescibacterota bacterium]NIO01071.1 sigma-70 family RNA polymerase sigma factor [Candidatus Latescibacterota bacterium]NIO27464.1 sigma-70 family RNA polymerase sigma factor [Candidatus Latescibacterota bacterium]NIO54986.1 sigma-70 family RNA polymerase sigma factor [Candidatus Latescibacterota bacterium]
MPRHSSQQHRDRVRSALSIDSDGSAIPPAQLRKIRVKEEDIELISLAKAGQEKAFRALLGKYQGSVYSICLRMVRDREQAADLAQDVFLKVFTMLDRYDPSYAFSSWLFKITSNLCIDHLRKRRVETYPMEAPLEGNDGEFARQYEAPDPTPETQMIRKEQMASLDKAVDALPPHYRMIILLRHQENLSYDEIAVALNIPLGTVKARIHRAREMLKERLKKEDI